MGQRRTPGRQRLEGISVFVRVRDAAGDEGESSQVVEINESETSVCVRDVDRPNKSIECAFDKVFGRDATQEDIFNGLVPALDTVVKGFNACVLAYGQTGSGKTHTLIGPGGGTQLPDDQREWGIIPRAVQFLFDRLNQESEEDETFSYSVTCSFLQIYNEHLVDLLLQDGGTATNSAPLQIREEAGGARGRKREGGDAKHGKRDQYRSEAVRDVGDAAVSLDGEGRVLGVAGHHHNRPISKPNGARAFDNRRVFVNGLSSFRVGGAQDVLRYVNLGAANRRVRATQHNEASSRSHAVMQLTVEVKSGGGNGGDEDGQDGVASSGHVTYRQAKLSLVDLAGSEKMDSGLHISSGHFKELRSINQSLSTLGNVVSALSEKGRTHVPYRDSKLTRLLQDSLGGNTRTTIIACVNPLAGQTHETINTLQFADRAKKVMVRIRANEVMDDRVMLARAQAEIKRLKRQLREALEGALLGEAAGDGDDNNETDTEVNCGVKPHGRAGGSDETVVSVKMVEDSGPGGCAAGPQRGTGVTDGNREGVVPTPTGVSNMGEMHRRSLAAEEKCETTRISGGGGAVTETSAPAAATAAATAAQKQKAAKLITENESLREENDRLRADVQRLIAQNNKQRSKRQRQQHQQRQRSDGRSGGTWIGGTGSNKPPPSPVDWSARYADAAADARRRRPSSSSSHRSRSLTRSVSSSSASRTAGVRGKRSTSPRPAAAAAAAAATAPIYSKFRRRQFDLDEQAPQGAGGVAEVVEDALSAEEVRVMIDINSVEVEMALASPAKLEEEKKEAEEVSQLDMFRRELRDGVVRSSYVKYGAGGEGHVVGGGSGGGESGASSKERDGRGDASGSDVNPDELTDMEVFLDQSQRLEDLMFEAQGRERQRLREERGRLASTRAERLALEAQLVALTGGDQGSVVNPRAGAGADRHVLPNNPAENSAVATNRNSWTMPPVIPCVPSPRTGCSEGRIAGVMISKHRPQHPQPQRPPPAFDGALSAQIEHGRTQTATTMPPTVGRPEQAGGTSSNGNSRGEEGRLRKGTGWAEQPPGSATSGAAVSATADPTPTPSTTAATTARMMAVLASAERNDCSNIGDVQETDSQGSNSHNNSSSELESSAGGGPGRTAPVTRPPREQTRHGGTAWMASTPFPTSPSSSLLSRRDSHPSTGSRRQRPATSTGYPPTGGSRRGSSRSRRIRNRAGVRMGGSRSPIRAGRLAFAELASPQNGHRDGRMGSGQQYRSGQKQQRRQQQQQQQGNTVVRSGYTIPVAATPSDTTAAAKALQATGNPPLSSTPGAASQRPGGKAAGPDVFRSDAVGPEGVAKRSLTYSVADLGLRLKVYSFRYDHYYECQVVGYDSRRRMHRCAYDATGERHWHDLVNKRFEVVGQNGVVVRSTASAPPAPAQERPDMDATNNSFSSNGSNNSSTPLLLLPTSPGNH